LKRYDVRTYNLNELVALFAIGSHGASNSSIENKPQIKYLHKYINSLGAKSLVYEDEYIDRHFLEDFAGYYSRCFTSYPRFCSRIHVFKQKFSARKLQNYIRRGASLNELGYLGFLVVKPLPNTIIGRSCLARPETPDWSGAFPCSLNISPHLYGMRGKVESNPFQEQDHEVSACATTALWTALASSGNLFTHAVPSPYKITKTAHMNSQFEHRSMPNDGLTSSQIARAIDAIELEPTIFTATSKELLPAGLYAYLRGGVSPILGFEFDPLIADTSGERHAVAVTGYRLSETSPSTTNRLRLRSSRIDRFYAHDDGIGPYSPIEFENGQLVTSWIRPGDPEENERWKAKPFLSIVPLYHKIRTPLVDVYNATRELDSIFRLFVANHDELEWDIFLTNNASFKKEVRDDMPDINGDKIDLLSKNLPRFLWRIICRFNDGEPIFEIALDATDLRQGGQVISYLIYNDQFCDSIAAKMKRFDLSNLKASSLGCFMRAKLRGE